MLIFDDHNWEQSSDSPNSNYLEGIPDVKQPKWVIDDNSELAEKIKKAKCWDAVEDLEGNLVDIEICEEVFTIDQKIENEKKKLSELDLSSIRAIRAIINGTDVNYDRDKIYELEQKAKSIREKIETLNIEKARLDSGVI